MDKQRIAEVRNIFNLDDNLTFNYTDDLDLWIIGGYSPVDIEDGLKFESPTVDDLPNGANSFRPYFTECDASEGFNVFKFKYPFIDNTGDIFDVDIFFISCVNNGTTYFACQNITVLQAFVLDTNESRRGDRPKDIDTLMNIDESFTFKYIDWAKWWVISHNEYASVECWPSNTKWESTSELPDYADKLFPDISKNGEIKELRSFCWFAIPFLDGEHEIREETIFAIKCVDNTMYFAAFNQDALRSALHWSNYAIRKSNEWRKNHPDEIRQRTKVNASNYGGTTIIVNGDMVTSKHVGNEVNNVATGGTGIQVNK